MDQVGMQTQMARAARTSRTRWAKAFVVLAIVSAIVGYWAYHVSGPTSLSDYAHNAVAAMAAEQCPQFDTVCQNAGYIRAQPIYLYVGFTAATVFLVIGLVLFATRPSAPERAWTDARA